MGISVIYPDLADSYVVCTSTTRPPAVDGVLIYETDTQRLMLYQGSAWTQVNPENHPSSLHGFGLGTIIGTNDFVGASWTNIIMSVSGITVPAWATELNYDITIGASGLTSGSSYDFRIFWILGALAGQTYSGVGLGSSAAHLMTVRFRQHKVAVGATGGPYTLAFQAQRVTGTGGIRQSVSHHSYDVWFT